MAYIKPFVRFNFKHPDKLGRRNKAKITKYFRALKDINKGFFPVKVKKGFKKAQIGLNPEFRKIKGRIKETEFKVIFVPKNNPPETVVAFDEKGTPYFQSTYAKQRFIPFEDKEKLIFHPKEYVAELVKDVPPEARITLQTPTADLSKYGYNKDTIAGSIESLVGDYAGEEGDGAAVWMLGLNITLVENQDEPF